MGKGNIPDEVRRFLADNIDTVPQLEALLLLWETAPTDWYIASVAARIYVSEPVASMLLEDLSRRGLLVRTTASPATFRFDPGKKDQYELLERVSASYRAELVRVAQFIHEKASGSVRDFARAFKLKGDDK
jgi:hypothetical protein